MKNIFLKSIFIGIPLIVIMLASGCERDPEEVVNYLRLSDSSFAFDDTGLQTYTVTVDSDPSDWEYKLSGDWIEVSDVTGTSLTVTVVANEEPISRSGKITVKNKFSDQDISIEQFGAPSGATGAAKVRIFPEFGNLVVSKGGTKAVAITLIDLGNGNYGTEVTTIDLATDQRTKLPSLAGDFEVRGVSDDGNVVIAYTMENQRSVYYSNGRWNDVESKFGSETQANVVNDISADGSVWVGWSQTGRTNYPMKWVNGVPEQLDMPEANLVGNASNGAYARGCSADGEVIIGAMVNNREAFYWKPDGTFHFLAPELQKMVKIKILNFMGVETEIDVFWTPVIEVMNYHLSPNGRYLSMNYSKFMSVNMQRTLVYAPLFIDLETGEYYELDQFDQSGGGAGLTATDNGTYFYATPGSGITEGFVYDMPTGSSQPIPNWIKTAFGIDMYGNYAIYKVHNNNTVSGARLVISSGLGILQIPWYVTTLGVE